MAICEPLLHLRRPATAYHQCVSSSLCTFSKVTFFEGSTSQVKKRGCEACRCSTPARDCKSNRTSGKSLQLSLAQRTSVSDMHASRTRQHNTRPNVHYGGGGGATPALFQALLVRQSGSHRPFRNYEPCRSVPAWGLLSPRVVSRRVEQIRRVIRSAMDANLPNLQPHLDVIRCLSLLHRQPGVAGTTELMKMGLGDPE